MLLEKPILLEFAEYNKELSLAKIVEIVSKTLASFSGKTCAFARRERTCYVSSEKKFNIFKYLVKIIQQT